MTQKTTTKTPLLDNIALNLARLYYRKDRASAPEVRRLAEHHTNPSLFFDDFLEGDTILPARQGFTGGTTIWEIAFINGSSRVAPAPHGEAADILVEDSALKLRVRHDPNFEKKSSKWGKGVAAAEKYNNAYVIGMRDFMPTPRQAVLIQCRMKIDAWFHGSTGIWVEEANTFDPKTGIMAKPFRSFGFSYLGEASDPYIRGLAIETALGLSIQGKQTVSDFDISSWHTYSMQWSWHNADTQRIKFAIDDTSIGQLEMHPFGPAEIQLWADNYQIGRGLQIGFLNVPDVDESSYDWVRVEAIDL
ncbi:MAG: hypothetical protein IT316_08715 [Anaerolineales bacterium]|nr:hypothetical protein [Anaerolineales bacterium]